MIYLRIYLSYVCVYIYTYLSTRDKMYSIHLLEICCSPFAISELFFNASNDHLFTGGPTKVENYAKEKPDPKPLALEFLPPKSVVFII